MDIVVQENFPEDHTIQIPTSYTTVEFKPTRFIQDLFLALEEPTWCKCISMLILIHPSIKYDKMVANAGKYCIDQAFWGYTFLNTYDLWCVLLLAYR